MGNFRRSSRGFPHQPLHYNGTVQWSYQAFNRTQGRLAQYIGGVWQYGPTPIAAVGSDPYTISRGSISGFGPFTISNTAALPVTWQQVTGYI